MKLLLRFFWVLISAQRKVPAEVLETATLRLQVWPTDLDVQIHMNNGRYLSIMDLERIDLLVRSGFWRIARARGWFPVVGNANIDYRRSLTLFERYTLATRVLGWDERWFYLEQIFERDGKVAASAIVKAMIRSRSGAVTPREVLSVLGADTCSPDLPPRAASLIAASIDLK
jgi:acyl-CoA thioesterase FadM